MQTLLKLIFGCLSFCRLPAYDYIRIRGFSFFLFSQVIAFYICDEETAHISMKINRWCFLRFFAQCYSRKKWNEMELNICFELIPERKLRLSQNVSWEIKLISHFQFEMQSNFDECFLFNVTIFWRLATLLPIFQRKCFSYFSVKLTVSGMKI